MKWGRIWLENLSTMNVFNGSTAFKPYTRTHTRQDYSRVVMHHSRDVENVTRRLWVDTGCEGKGSASFKDALTSIYTQLAGVAGGSNPALTFKVLPVKWMQDAFLRGSVKGMKVGGFGEGVRTWNYRHRRRVQAWAVCNGPLRWVYIEPL